jgi:hypothetical protein
MSKFAQRGLPVNADEDCESSYLFVAQAVVQWEIPAKVWLDKKLLVVKLTKA